MADNRFSPSSSQIFPDWQQPLEAAVRETDPQKLPQLLEAAEAAIFLRSQSLVNSPDSHAERSRLHDGMRTIRAIQIEKLLYPDWEGQ